MRKILHALLMVMPAALFCAAPAFADAGLKAPAKTPAGGPFKVTWTGPEERGRLEIVKADGSKFRGASYGFANKNKTVMLTAPVEAGQYAVKFAQGTQVFGEVKFEVTPVTATLSAPPTAVVSQQFEVTWTGPAYKQDRVMIATAEGKRLPGASFAHVAKSTDGAVKLTAPLKPGNYTVVYFMQGKNLAESKLVVAPSPPGS